MAEMIDATDTQMAMIADLVAGLQAAEQTISGMQAARDGMLAMASRLALEIAQQSEHPDYGDTATRTIAAEIGAAQRTSDRTIERRMAQAARVVEDFPAVWAAQGAGRISAAHSRVIVEAGAHIDAAADRAAFAAEVLKLAETESPNRLRPQARRIAEEYQARSIDDRHRTAREKRRVWIKDLDDGMSELGVYGPSALLHGMFDRLSQMAHRVREDNARAATGASTADEDAAGATPEDEDAAGASPADEDAADAAGADAGETGAPDAAEEFNAAEDHRSTDDRTTDQLRADLLADLALTGAPSEHDSPEGLLDAIQARIEVTVPVIGLMGSDALQRGVPPAELDGMCPMDIGSARRLAGAATGWERVLTHPISGALLAVDRYRPGDQLKRHLRARDQRCRFPACGLAARKCDIDHNHAAAEGGATCESNLAHFCRRHHVMKHHSPWRVTQTTGGVLEWRSPTGRIYVDRPPRQNTVRFEPDQWETPSSGSSTSSTEPAVSSLVPF